MIRLTTHNKFTGREILRTDLPNYAEYDPIIRLAAYEDTGLDPCEIVKLKAERDAAVRDIVEAMEADLSMCVLTHQCWFCAFYNSDDCPLEKDGECAPTWRGPQQEPHWIDNADSYVCSSCGYECNNPNLLKDGPSVCPNCKRQMKATYGPQQEET